MLDRRTFKRATLRATVFALSSIRFNSILVNKVGGFKILGLAPRIEIILIEIEF